MTDHCVVSALFNYPVKSCRGTSVEAATIAPTGIDGDRQLMILKDGKFTNQARLPKLATVATRRIDPETIEFDVNGQTLTHGVSAAGTESDIDFYGNTVAVVDQGDEVAALVSDAVATDVRVAALKETFRRAVTERVASWFVAGVLFGIFMFGEDKANARRLQRVQHGEDLTAGHAAEVAQEVGVAGVGKAAQRGDGAVA